MGKAILVVLLLSGCIHSKYFMLENGEVVRCKEYGPTQCGLYIGDCDDESEYECQQNVKIVKPLELEPTEVKASI